METIAKDILNELEIKNKSILEFFNLKKCRKIQINIFIKKEDFINAILPFYKNRNEIPSYCIGTIHEGKIYYLIDSTISKEEYRYELQLRHIIHEYIHIIYNEYIKKGKRSIWLDEGLAINLSKEKAYLNDKEKYRKFIDSIKCGKTDIDMEELNHEGNFVKGNLYNGYDLSYLCVRYIIETYPHNEIIELIEDTNKIEYIGKDILQKAIKYYEN